MTERKRALAILSIGRLRIRWLTTWLLVIGAAAGDSAEPRPAGVQPLDKDATLENAFAALGADTIPDGRLFAPFYDYVIAPHALATSDAVYCAFQNRLGQPQVMVYRTEAKTWDGPVTASAFGLKTDDHGNPAVCLDREGYLHVFYGCHGGPMRHTRSTAPRDITQWEEQPPPTPRATYPQTMLLADGTLCLFYRAGGQSLSLPISKAEADRRCLVFDSGDEFAMLRTRLAVDRDDRPYIRFGVGVVDWVRLHKDPSAVLVPITDHYARFGDGQWRVSRALPAEWPAEVARVLRAPGVLAYGDGWPAGHWSIFASRQAIAPGVGCCVFLYHDQAGYAVRAGGPAKVD